MSELGTAAVAAWRDSSASSQIYTDKLASLMSRYVGEPLEVSFRQLVGVLPADDQTHAIFPYPARLVRHIPRMMLACDQVVNGIDQVLDPFCGSGTVLLEARNRGLDAYGIDQNPVAALVSDVKTTFLPSGALLAAGAEVLGAAKSTRRTQGAVGFLERWYSPASYSALVRLSYLVNQRADDAVGRALRLVLVVTARRVSRADRRIPVPVKDESRPEARSADVWAWWTKECAALDSRVSRLSSARSRVIVRAADARAQDSWADIGARSNLLFTSPPYGAAQKYIRSTSLDAGWLGLAADRGTIDMERASIGREHLTKQERDREVTDSTDPMLIELLERIRALNPARAAIYVEYFRDMESVALRARRSNVKRMVMISGANTVCGLHVPTNEILGRIFGRHGMRLALSLRDPIRGRSLMTTRRSGALPAPAEFVDLFEASE